VAGFITGSYWASFTLGRIVAGLWSTRVDARRLVAGGIALAVVGVVLVWVDIGPAATVAGIAVTGLVIAPIFPGLMSDTRNRVGMRHLSNTIGMQIAAAGLGGAALPGLAGVVARQFGVNAIPPFLFVNLVLLLAMFALSHHRQATAR
jgi:fucose permease